MSIPIDFHACNCPAGLRTHLEKKRIANRFSKAAFSYDGADKLQTRIAQRLVTYCPEYATTILDLGCGTGKWTCHLATCYPQANVTGVDFSTGMIEKARQRYRNNVQWCLGDIERLPFANESVDLAFSNLAVQWCGSLEQLLLEVARVLKPGGRFIFSTLTEGSLFEMRSIWQLLDDGRHVNEYQSLEQQLQACNESPLTVERSRSSTEIFYYPCVESLLSEFKALGVNTVILENTQGLMAPSKLRRFITHYEQLGTAEGIPCSYNVLYVDLMKNFL